MKKYTFGKSRQFAMAFAWHEANECGHKVKVEKAGGQWTVKVDTRANPRALAFNN